MKKVKTLFVVILIMIFSLPSHIFADVINSYDTSNFDAGEKDVLEYYLINTDDGMLAFDADKAEADGLSDYSIEVGKMVEKFSEAEAYTTNNIVIPVYGNYCGLGWGTGTGTKTPIDDLDYICQQHDKCYYNHSSEYKCLCDLDFCRAVKAKKGSWTGTKRKVADAGERYFYKQAKDGIKSGACLNKWNW